MEVEDIKNEDSLKAWLNARPEETRQSDAIAIACRCALRVSVLFGQEMSAPWARKADLTALPILRLNSTSGVVRKYPTPEVRAAARAAAAAAPTASYAARAAAASYASAASTVAAASYADASAASTVASTATAAAATAPATAARSAVWDEVRRDAQNLEQGEDPFTTPLWPSTPPDWFTKADTETRAIWAKDPPGTWDFWTRWWDGVLSGQQLPWGLQKAVALIPDDVWSQGPIAVAEAIREIEPKTHAPVVKPSPLARTYLFDFVEHNKKLRLAGVALDFEGRSPEEIEKCLSKVKDWKSDLLDWLDYSKDEQASPSNEPSRLQKAAQRLIDLIDTQANDKDFSAGRLLTLGGNLRLLALDEIERKKVGDTLAKMMDQRIDELSALIGNCFGHVLERLEPLNELALGSHDPAVMIAAIRSYLDALKALDPAEVVPLDAAASAQIKEMLRELEEMDAAISASSDPKQIAVLQARFANRYGAIASTIGRALEKGRELGFKAVSRFDDAVKWYRRWDTIERIIAWFDKLPPS